MINWACDINMKISALFSMWIWNRCVVPSIMSNVSDKNCVFNKMAIHQKRKASVRGNRTQNICFIMTLFYSTLNVFSGSINYLSEGALIQPTLSFSTTGSHSSGKTRYYFYIRYFCNNIDFLNVFLAMFLIWKWNCSYDTWSYFNVL